VENIIYKNSNVYIKNAENFDLAMTLDCGQAFRWKCDENGVWSGVVKGKALSIKKENNDIVLLNTSKEDFLNIWYDYFDLNRDYGKIIKKISCDNTLKKASSFGEGIRILNQEPFEALCSFIISQNNNIPRIKGIIERLCAKYGEKIGEGYSFPTARVLSKLNVDDLSDIRMGFRAKYIIDASKKVASGEINLNSLIGIDTDTARQELMKIKGVGPKVADCTLLFSLKHFSAFPKDVWIKRALEELFPQGVPECAKEYGGIVQQYIFFYSRSGNLNK